MKQLETQGFRRAIRLGRRHIKVMLHGDRMPSHVWSNYDMARNMERPVQRMPKVGHFSTPRAERR